MMARHADELRPRTMLAERRSQLALTLREAGKSINVSHQCIAYIEGGTGRGSNSTRRLIVRLCRAYMREAQRLGYDPAPFHESQACPDEGFLSPAQEAAVRR